MLHILKAFRAYVLLSLLACSSLMATNAKSPTEVVEHAAKGLAAAIMQNKEKVDSNASFTAKLIEKHMLPVVDREMFAKRSLGKKSWASMKPEQQKDFTNGLMNRLINSYSGLFQYYNGEKMTFKEPRFNEKKTKAQVQSDIFLKEPVTVLYNLREKDGKWYIYDIKSGGISLVKTYRVEFNDARANKVLDQKIKDVMHTKLNTH